MRFLLNYLFFIIPALALWHLVMADQKQLKAHIFCQICETVLRKKETLPFCSQCVGLGWAAIFQEEVSEAEYEIQGNDLPIESIAGTEGLVLEA